MPALGAVFAILMALTLASEASFLTSAQGIVGNEAADATRLARAATAGVNSAPIQAALLGNLQATRANECTVPTRRKAAIPQHREPSHLLSSATGARRGLR